jgi:UDP-3-O-[3-hydroxymyristoyl] glucosamine N-acyltransferase
MKYSLLELSTKFNLEVVGDLDLTIQGVATLEKADKKQLSFLSNSKYTSQLSQTNAGVVLLSKLDADKYSGNKLIADDVYVSFAKIASLFLNQSTSYSGIHNTALISESATIGEDVTIGPYCIIGDNVVIGRGSFLVSNVTIEADCKIGQNCILKPNSVVSFECSLGNRVILHPGAIIGADGFGLARDKDGWIKVPQLGCVQIGDDCEIGANTTIDRGTLEDTILENDVRLDNQIQIAHNVYIGAHTVMAGCSAVAGSAKIGKNCLIGGGVGIVGHLEVCDGVTLQSMALVTGSIRKPGSYSSVSPLQKTQDWRRNAVRFRQLDKMARKLNQIEKKIKLEKDK